MKQEEEDREDGKDYSFRIGRGTYVRELSYGGEIPEGGTPELKEGTDPWPKGMTGRARLRKSHFQRSFPASLTGSDREEGD